MIRDHLLAVVSATPTRHSVREIVEMCRKMAFVYLLRRAKTGNIRIAQGGLSLESMSWDLIAEIFTRSSEGQFIILQEAFSETEIEKSEDPELVGILRRLVFHAVNDGVFRTYRDSDPVLSRIIRNLKQAICIREGVSLGNYCGRQVMMVNLNREGPVLDFDDNELESWLVTSFKGDASIPSVLEQILHFVTLLPFVVQPVNLARLAIIVRKSAVRLNGEIARNSHQSDPFLVKEIDGCISRCIAKTKIRKQKKYVPHKMTKCEYDQYFDALCAFYHDLYGDVHTTSESYFHYLKKERPELTLNDYRKTHRSKMEYLSRLIDKRVKSEFRNLFS